jgi:hypothetical protein
MFKKSTLVAAAIALVVGVGATASTVTPASAYVRFGFYFGAPYGYYQPYYRPYYYRPYYYHPRYYYYHPRYYNRYYYRRHYDRY